MHQPSCYLLTNTSEEKCVSVNIYLLLHSFCLSVYITYTNRIINSLLFSFSVFSVDNKKTHYSSHTSFCCCCCCSESLQHVYDSENLLKKRAIFINYPIKCMYYIVSVHDMVVKSLSAFPLQILLSEVYNYNVKLASSTIKFQLEEIDIKIYFQQELGLAVQYTVVKQFSLVENGIQNVSHFLSFTFLK